MGAAQVDRLTVSKILNHAEGGMTRIYDRYSNDAEKRAALDAWALVIEQACSLNVVSLGGARADEPPNTPSRLGSHGLFCETGRRP